MDAATDGNYRLNVGLQYPTQDDYTDAGKETYNIKDSARAKQYLQQSGHKGEPVILLTSKDYSSTYYSALVMAEQMKAVGINAHLKVVDGPTSMKMALKPDTGWNFFPNGVGTPVALGGLDVIQILINPNAIYQPNDGKDDPDLLAAWRWL